MVDGVMPYVGGEMMVTKVRGVPAYAGKDVGYAAALPVTNQPGDAFTMYPVDNLDIGSGGLPATKKLACKATFASLGMKRPGEMRPVYCPGDCEEDGALSGSNIFTPGSSVCRAAEFAHAVGSEGGYAIVTRGHAQPYYFGSKSSNLRAGSSTDSAPTDESAGAYTIHLPVPDVMARSLKKDPPDFRTPKEEAMPSPALSALLTQPLCSGALKPKKDGRKTGKDFL